MLVYRITSKREMLVYIVLLVRERCYSTFVCFSWIVSIISASRVASG